LKFIRFENHAIFWAVVSGLALTAAFPKAGVSWLAWGALVPLLAAVKDKSARQSFGLGLIAGCTHYLTLVYWLADTMRTFGQLHWLVCLPVLFLFAFYLALYTAGFAVFISRGCRHPVILGVFGPVGWVGFEYIRAVFLSGFPWEMLGYSQYQVLPIIQISDMFGVYGVSFLVAVGNTALFLVYQAARSGHWQGKRIQFKHAAWVGVFFFILLFLSWGYGEKRIADVDQRISAAPAPEFAVIQGNIDQASKWDPAFRLHTLEKYISLSRFTAQRNPVLIIWPETATPFYFMAESDYSPGLIQAIRAMGCDHLIGSPAFENNGGVVSYRNRAYLVTSDGDIADHYDKAQLVPFGEYVPLKRWMPFIGKIVEAVGDFEPGVKGKTLQTKDYRLGIQICYEMIFPGLSRKLVQNGANCIVNITNDAWYGTSSAPYQLFSMAVFRAVENRRTVIRAANTGISGFIDPVGRILGTTGLFKDAAMTQPVPMLTKTSPYTRWGDSFALICLATTIILVFSGMVPPKKRAHH
jgi:apolipoprotein N-acyltransferase